MSPRPTVLATVVAGDPQAHEDAHVHQIYDQIASHFSSTRYKPWPLIARFLSSIPTGWVGLDSGTGNGKYLPFAQEHPGGVWMVGLDRNLSLLGIARTAGVSGTVQEVVLGDVLGNGWRQGAFDFAISIATIHHLATPERRRKAIRRLLQCISPEHGRVLIYVWATKQDELSKRDIPCDPQQNGVGQDVLVPWVLSAKKSKKEKTGAAAVEEPIAYNRYYHMFDENELVALVCSAAEEMELQVLPYPGQSSSGRMGVEIVQEGWERSNYYVELKRWQC